MWLSMEFYAWTLLVIAGVWFVCYCYVYVEAQSTCIDRYFKEIDKEKRLRKEKEEQEILEDDVNEFMCTITKGTYIWVDVNSEDSLIGEVLYRVTDLDIVNKIIKARNLLLIDFSYLYDDKFNLYDELHRIRLATKDEVLNYEKKEKERKRTKDKREKRIKDIGNAEIVKTTISNYGDLKDRPW